MERYELYKDSGVEWIGEIPARWEFYRLKTVILCTSNGVWGDDPQNHENDVICIRVADFDMTILGVSEEKLTIRNIPSNQLDSRLLDYGDLLIEKSGGGEKQSVGRVVQNTLSKRAVSSNFVSRLSVDSGKVQRRFLTYIFNTMYSVRLNTRSIKQTTGIQNLDLDSYLNELIYLPPSTEEQTAIANYLDRKTAEIDALIAQKQRLIELYQEEKTAIINQAVTQGIGFEKGNHKGLPLRDSGIDWLGEIPDGWEVAELRRFIRFITSGSRGWAEHYADEGKIFVRIGNLTRHSIDIDLSDIQYVNPPVGAEGERTKICEGDVLFSITAYIGSVAVATDAIAGAYINQHIALVRPLMDKVFPRYVAYVALSDLGQSQLSSKVYGGTKVQLALDDVKSLLIPAPPLPEQTAIVHHIETETARIDAKIAKTQRIIELQKEYRTALISEVVTGKIKVIP